MHDTVAVDVANRAGNKAGMTKRKHGGFKKTAQDEALIRYKRDNTEVALTLALDTDYSDNDGRCKVFVIHVDVYSVLFRINDREIWINKPFIVSAEPLNV